MVGATCLAIRHPIFSLRTFDVCITDEASQLTEPVSIDVGQVWHAGVLIPCLSTFFLLLSPCALCFFPFPMASQVSLGPLRSCRSFVLVGDHQQLPPLVQSSEASAAGLSTSLFKRLAMAHPAAIATLSVQYRMHADIQLLANALVYSGALTCGSAAVAQAPYSHITASALEAAVADWQRRHCGSGSAAAAATATGAWLRVALFPSHAVRFVDTDGALGWWERRPRAEGGQRSHAGAVINPLEIQVVADVVAVALAAGARGEDIGVISPYRSQLRYLRSAMEGVENAESVEVSGAA